MIRVQPGDPTMVRRIQRDLRALQTTFEHGKSYAARVGSASPAWEKAQKDNTDLFLRMRSQLGSMVPGGLAVCMYCGRSEAHQIDHFKSMAWYPELLFSWANYLYACGVCNQKKGSKLRLYGTNGREITYARSRKATPVPPPDGAPLLINPRDEDPMLLLRLDLDTGILSPSRPKGSIEHSRADHTITKLGLNQRQLPEQRAAVYQRSYRSSLREYVTSKAAGQVARPDLSYLSLRLVWEEMKRQANIHLDLIPLFAAAPEARGW